MGQKLTIHQVITITNFAKANDVEIVGGKSTSDINKKTLETTYQLIIPSNGYGENGYIRKVQIN